MKLKWCMDSLFLLWIWFVLIAAGCSTEADPETKSVDLVIHSFYSDHRVEMLKDVVEHYTTNSNKEIHVRFETIPDDFDRLGQLEALYKSGEQVDLIWVPGTISHSELALRGYADSLSHYMANLNLADYYIDLSRFEFAGQLYALPLRWTEYVIYYNKDVFDRYQVPYPHHEWTYEELAEAASRLTIPEEGIIGIQHGSSLFYTVGGAYAGATFDESGGRLVLNSEDALAGIRFLVDQFRYNKIDGRIGEDLSQGFIAEPEFFDGHVAMTVSTTTAHRAMTEHVPHLGMAPFPRGDAQQLGLSELDSMAISPLSEHKEEAFDLLRYLTSDIEGVSLLVQSGFTLPLLRDEQLYAEWHQFYGDEYADTIQFILQNNEHNFGFPPPVPGYSNMLMKAAPLFIDPQQGLYSGLLEPDEQFANMIETINLEWELERVNEWEPLYDQWDGN